MPLFSNLYTNKKYISDLYPYVQKVPKLFLKKRKNTDNTYLSDVSFKVVALCHYAFLPTSIQRCGC